MGTYISQFNLATLLLNTDLVAGLRGTAPNQTDYKFPIIGIGDSLGSPIIAWTQGAGTMLSPNINSINFQNNVAGSAPIISTLSSGLTPDTSVNLNIGAFGPLGYVQFTGTNAIAIPAGTAAQAPATFVGGGIRYNTTSQYLDYWSTVSNSWVDLTTGSALSNLTFVTNTNETAFAPNSQALSLLSTGIAYVTTTTGIIGTRTLTGTANEITIGNGTGSAGNPTFSIPSTFIAPGTIQATTSSAATSFLLNGATDGVISILPQTHAGTFNFNMPITAGTSGYLLTSAGGGSSPMTWSNISSIAVSSIAGTANEITASASTGAVTLSIPNTFIAPGTLSAVTSIATGTITISGSSIASTANPLAISSSAGPIILTPVSYGAGVGIFANLNISGPGVLNLYEATNTYQTSFAGTAAVSDAPYVMPPALPAGNGYTVSCTTAGVWTWVAPAVGTVTSVGLTSSNTSALTVTGSSPITGSGSFALASFGNLLSFQILTSGTAATYTKNTNATSILVECFGGGGAGGSATATAGQFSTAGGGGAGGYCRKLLTSASATYTYTIGAGGTPGAGGTNPGGAGGATTFSGGTLSAGGGAGGTSFGGSTTYAIGGYGGLGGTSSGGDINANGAPGIYGLIYPTGPASGIGGSTLYGGGGGAPASSQTDGTAAAANSGAGGSAANSVNGGGAQQGGAGGSGLIYVWEFS